MLGNPTKLADYPRIQQAKIRLAKDKLDIGNDTENFIEEPGNDSPEQGRGLVGALGSMHDIVSLEPQSEHARNHLRGVLKIGVHGDYDIPLRTSQAC